MFNRQRGFRDTRRTGLYENPSLIPEEFYWDVKTDNPNNIFLVQNSVNLTERYFKASELIDGTYSTWLNGSNGNIKEWLSQNNTIFTPDGTIKLTGGSSAAVIDGEESDKLKCYQNFDFSGDWVVSSILNWIEQPANLRVSLSIIGAAPEQTFSFFCRRSMEFYMYVNKAYISNQLPTHEVTGLDLSNGNPMLWTFSNIGGVFKASLNGVNKTLGKNPTQTWKYSTRGAQPINSILVGGIWDSGLGVKHNWKHIGVITGQKATNLNLTNYNNELLTRYGI
jgi:hypothetical protein